jgi:hypothetical protein
LVDLAERSERRCVALTTHGIRKHLMLAGPLFVAMLTLALPAAAAAEDAAPVGGITEGLSPEDQNLVLAPMALTDFEMDGNAVTGHAGSGLPDDWDRVLGYVPGFPGHAGVRTDSALADFGDLDHTRFTGGSKDDLPISTGWKWDQNQPNDKVDLTNAYACQYGMDLFLGCDRFATEGTAEVGFWLLQDDVGPNPGGTFYGQHMDGDILISTNFTSGGRTPIAYVYRWTGDDATGTLVPVAVSGPDVAVQYVNADSAAAPWPYLSKRGDTYFPARTFLEAYANLDSLGISACFSHFMAVTRTSAPVGSEMKDWVLGSFPAVPVAVLLDTTVCQTDPPRAVRLCPEVTSGVSPFTYQWTTGSRDSCINVTGTGTYGVFVIGANQCSTYVEARVTFSPPPECSIGGPDQVCPSTSNQHCGPDGMAYYSWSISGNGAISGSATQQCVTVLAGSACAQSYTLSLEVTNAATCASTCQKIVMVTDTEAPRISCPADTTIDCAATPAFGTPTASDNCDPSPRVREVSTERRAGACAQESVYVRTWEAVDACGNVSGPCSQTITKQDNTAPRISCPADTTIDCAATPAFGTPTASDNCDPSPTVREVSTERRAGRCPQESVYVRTWEAVDACGNVSGPCSQTITKQDNTAPVLYCAPDDTLACNALVQFTDPRVSDDCDLAPVVTIAGTDTIPGPGMGETTYRRCWTATDACGNVADTCCQHIIVQLCPPCTFTMGGWGSGCPASQQDRPMSTQPGCIRDHFFSTVFGSDGVTLGGSPYHVTWTDSAAVEAYLPAGGKPGMFTVSVDNPTETPAGVLGGQLLALTLNVRYSCKEVFYTLHMQPSVYCYGDYRIPTSCGSYFAGMTVADFLVVANRVIAGNPGALDPYHAKIGDLVFTATCLNELFDECSPVSVPSPTGTTPPEEPIVRAEDTVISLPTEFAVTGIRPNPLTQSTTINYGLPTDGVVRIDIFSVLGRKVTTLVSNTEPAGYHSVVWDGRDGSGAAVAEGVYFLRAQMDDRPAVMTKLVKLQ